MNDNGTILGRFNFLTVKPGKYLVLFVPPHGSHCAIIARDLPREEAIALVHDLNTGLQETLKELKDVDHSHPPAPPPETEW